MRIRPVLGRAVAIASVLTSTTLLLAAPASAGTPNSGLCSDGVGFIETPVMTSPFTLAAEINRSPLTPTSQQIQLCYSTTAENQPGGITGGWVVVMYDLTLGTTHNTVRVTVQCNADSGVTLPVDCFEQSTVETFPAGVLPTVGTPPTTICLVDLGGGCVLYLSGVLVRIPPVLRITLPPTVDVPPAQCIALLATC